MRTSFHLPYGLWIELRDRARLEERSVSWIIRNALRLYLRTPHESTHLPGPRFPFPRD